MPSYQPRYSVTEIAGVFKSLCVWSPEWVVPLYISKTPSVVLSLTYPAGLSPNSLLPLSYSFEKRRKSHFHSSIRQTSLERQKSLTLGRMAALELRGLGLSPCCAHCCYLHHSPTSQGLFLLSQEASMDLRHSLLKILSGHHSL